MTNFFEEVDRFFPAVEPVSKEALVKWDGYDELEKGSAQDAFGGKSAEEIFQLVREAKEYAYRSTNLESWAVLEPQPLRYYLGAYLKALILEVNGSNPDVDFIDRVFFELTEAIKIKSNVELFSENQRSLLSIIGQFVLQVILKDNEGRFEIGGDHIVKNIEKALAALGGQVAG